MAEERKNQEEQAQDIPCVNKKFAIAMISLFMAVIALPMLLWGILALIPGGYEYFEVELNENRNPAKMPEKIDLRTLTADLEAYINDRLPFRSLLVSTQNKFENSIEAPYKNTIRPALIKLLYSDLSDGGSTVIPIDPPDNSVIVGGNGNENEKDEPVVSGGDEECTHEITEEIIINEATCLVAGEKQIKCTTCDYTETHTLPNGHIGDIIKIVEASFEDYGYTLNKCSRCGGEYRTDISGKLYDSTPLPLNILGTGAVEGKHKWLFYNGNNSLGYYQNTNQLTQKKLEDSTALFQELNDLCVAQGKQLVIMIMPNKEQIYSEHMPTLEVTAGDKRTQVWVDYVTANSDVKMIYPYDELIAAKPYWQVYSRLDTHWNAAGGFVGLQALYKALGLETTTMYDLPIIESLENTISNSDLINIGKVNKADYGDDTDYDIHYKENITVNLVKTGNGYGYQTNDITITESDSPNKCNFVFLGDSFRKNMVRFLIKDFSNTFCTHRSKLGENAPEVIEAVKNSDILVLAAAERADENLINTAKKVIEILKENQ